MGRIANIRRALGRRIAGRSAPRRTVSQSDYDFFARLAAFHGAEGGRLFGNWTKEGREMDEYLIGELGTLRARSRWMGRNNDYGKKWQRTLRTNVAGPNGILLEMDVGAAIDKPDHVANQVIEEQWAHWGKRGFCTVDRQMSWVDAQQLYIKTLAEDGEVFIQRVRRRAGPRNPFGFQLKFIPATRLGTNINGPAKIKGNRIIMGVEVNEDGAPVAYHFYSSEGTDVFQGYRTVRILAEEILHSFIMDEVGQHRGIPWAHTALDRLKLCDGYEETELVAARVASSKVAYWKRDKGTVTPFEGAATKEESVASDDPNDTGGTKSRLIEELDPGRVYNPPPGVSLEMVDPQHPAQNYAPFIASVLRGAASGMDISYETLANDRSQVNFSSIRQGELKDRDGWQSHQRFMIEHLMSWAFQEWLEWAFVAASARFAPLSYARLDEFIAAARWAPRGWQWIDPYKEAKAEEVELSMLTTSRTAIAKKRGINIKDVFNETQKEKEAAEAKGIDLPTVKDLTGVAELEGAGGGSNDRPR